MTDVVSESPDGVRTELGQVWVKVRTASRRPFGSSSGAAPHAAREGRASCNVLRAEMWERRA
jgi:hypothetical protein